MKKIIFYKMSTNIFGKTKFLEKLVETNYFYGKNIFFPITLSKNENYHYFG